MYQVATLSFALDLLAAELDVGGRGAAEVVDRRRPAQDLVGRQRHQLGVVAQALELVGVLDQREQALGDRVARGLVAGDGEQQEVDVVLVLGQRAAVDLGLDQLGDDVVARALAALVGELAPVLEHLQRRRVGEGEVAVGLGDLGVDRVLGVVLAEHPVADARRGGGGRPPGAPSISANTRIGRFAATSSTNSTSPFSSASSRTASKSSRMRSVKTRTARGVKSRLTIARSALCGGGSMSIIDLRASSSSGSRSWSEVPPSSEEKVRQSLATAVMSAWRVIAQKPRPVGLLLPVDRVLAAQDREHLVRDALGEARVVGEVDLERDLFDRDRHQRWCRYSARSQSETCWR